MNPATKEKCSVSSNRHWPVCQCNYPEHRPHLLKPLCKSNTPSPECVPRRWFYYDIPLKSCCLILLKGPPCHTPEANLPGSRLMKSKNSSTPTRWGHLRPGSLRKPIFPTMIIVFYGNWGPWRILRGYSGTADGHSQPTIPWSILGVDIWGGDLLPCV